MRPADAVIRPMTAGDMAAADAAGWAALRSQIPEQFIALAEAGDRQERALIRFRHLLEHDPGGCHVAEAGGEVVGVALALVREGVWGLSLFGVHPDHQGKGIGARLLQPALAYGADARGGIIASSLDPRAQRRYARAGFALRPSFAASGAFNRSRIPDGLRSRDGDPDADRTTIDAASRHVRGASHALDVPAAVATGGRLLVCEDRGFAVARDGAPILLAALDTGAAGDLFWSCLATADPGAEVHVDFMTAEQQWIVPLLLDADLTLAAEGPVFTRGDTGPFTPFLPSGAFL